MLLKEASRLDFDSRNNVISTVMMLYLWDSTRYKHDPRNRGEVLLTGGGGGVHI